MSRSTSCFLMLLFAGAPCFFGIAQAADSDFRNPLEKNYYFLLPVDTVSRTRNYEVMIDSLSVSGNTLTRPEIIFRELPFSLGDLLGEDRLGVKLEEGRQNLMNTGLFNFVEVRIDDDRHPGLHVHYEVLERWNIWPLPVLELDEPNLNQWLEDPDFSSFNYGIHLLMSNLTGNNERLRLEAKAGNVQSLDFSLITPYFDERKSIRWGLRYSLHRTKRRAYATEDSEQLFVRLPDDYVSTEYLLASQLYFRPGLYSVHRLNISYHYHNYADTLLKLNPRFGPQGQRRFFFTSIGYTFRHDRRDLAAYPLHGYLIEAGITRKGLWDLESMDVTSLEGAIKHYFPLEHRWYAAWSIAGTWSEGSTLSYFDREGLGYNRSLVRGYEPYVIDGHKYLVAKTNIKYNLLTERQGNISFIRSEQFSRIHYALFVNVFFDAGIIDDRHHTGEETLANRWLGGTGLGLDLHTYYDTVLRGEITINRHGETGVFFHLVAPI